MEYFVGSIVTLIMVVTLGNYFRNKNINPPKIFHSQSRQYTMLLPYTLINPPPPEKRKSSQVTRFEEKRYKRVVFYEDLAYWISDNTFYVANHNMGQIDKESASQVDTMVMNSVQLKKMVFIIEQLTEGIQDDSGDTE